ncbi:ANTAR domain-containing protein [Rhodococcus opacus]|uniref:ANTAR domain-containing protein n=1 Tax=Rhodococcus opacus TaxID=37919 RepID=UPI000AB7D03C|nr:ANTAR domain-containing protein [Rhodococcus opacus]MDX5969991.1 ANTAR domain-containing protein [Rhodococcus opacus]CAG7635019.1 hypothetical protein E143388_07664 [Rhodococcus opacus]
MTTPDPFFSNAVPTTARGDLDLAKRIIMDWKGCSRWQAFDEIIDVAQRTHVSPLQLARELVRVVGTAEPTPKPGGSLAAITAQWGRYIGVSNTAITHRR